MTVIAGFNMMGKAALVGDLLGSSQARPSTYVPLPMVTDPQCALWKRLGYQAGLFRKLFLISPYLCIAWTGGQRGAARVVNEVSQVAGPGPVPKRAFLDYMDASRRTRQPASESFIILVIYDTGKVELVATARAQRINDLPEGMQAFCAGSGWDHAAELVLRRGALHQEGPWEDSRGLAHKLVGCLLSREAFPGTAVDSANPLLRRYGAGYEIAYLRDGRIELDSDTTFLFWRAHFSAQGQLTFVAPHILMRNAYPDGKLVIRSATVQEPWSTAVEVPHNSQLCLTVPRINEPAAERAHHVSVLTPTYYPSFLSGCETSVFKTSIQNGPALVATVTQPNVEGHTHNINYTEQAGSTKLQKNSLAVEGLRETLQREFNSTRFNNVIAELQTPIRRQPTR